MPSTIDEISRMLSEMEIQFAPLPDQAGVIAGFKTSIYVDKDGDHSLPIFIILEENGEFLKVFSPMMYNLKGNPHTRAVTETLLNICFVTKMLQFEFDPRDGEVRAIVEFPIEDSQLTKKQLNRCIGAINILADQYHSIIMDAIETGKTPDEESFLRSEYEMRLAALRRQKGDIGLEE